MTITLLISIVGAITSVLIALGGSWFAYRNGILMQIRKLKEEHYIDYVEALHNLAADNVNKDSVKKYVLARDKMLIIANENVIKKMLLYETEAVGKPSEMHDVYLTDLIISIRVDLRMQDKSFPKIYFKK